MGTKEFGKDILLSEIKISDKLFLCITKGKLSKFDVKVNYKDLLDSQYRKTPKHIHWIFDIMVKKEHKKEEIKIFVNFLLKKWNILESDFCSEELKKLHNGTKSLQDLFDEIKKDLINFVKLDNYGYFPKDFLALFGYLMILQEKNNNSNAYMFRNMLEGVINDEYNPYKIISIATGKYSN